MSVEDAATRNSEELGAVSSCRIWANRKNQRRDTVGNRPETWDDSAKMRAVLAEQDA
jgi:hypothetical protein